MRRRRVVESGYHQEVEELEKEMDPEDYLHMTMRRLWKRLGEKHPVDRKDAMFAVTQHGDHTYILTLSIPSRDLQNHKAYVVWDLIPRFDMTPQALQAIANDVPMHLLEFL